MNMPNSSPKLSPSVHSSMLWAASADAMGWITELVDSQALVKRRAGRTVVVEPTAWRRRIGGIAGVNVHLPSGTYSDDTQLRLSVCRAISTGGAFDVEAFAKIELPVWLNYALGAGLGSKAAAQNLAKKGVGWFSNFFESKGSIYVKGGGNGAAMRIQPHVLAAPPGSFDLMISSVLRNSIVTHGHIHGFGGAHFHALCLHHVFRVGQIPGPEFWLKFADSLIDIPSIASADPQLSAFWIKSWEMKSGLSLRKASVEARDDLRRDIERVAAIVDGPDANYSAILNCLSLRDRATRGSGILTALASVALAWMYRYTGVRPAIETAVNELGTDTDTIATMTAAMLGAISPRPSWAIQDEDYISMEADRLSEIRTGARVRAFGYPDLSQWRPPMTQSAAIASDSRGFALKGIGKLTPIGQEYFGNDEIWQWMRLDFGQTVLTKRKSSGVAKVSTAQMPASSSNDLTTAPSRGEPAKRSSLVAEGGGEVNAQSSLFADAGDEVDLDASARRIAESNFNAEVIGREVLKLIDRPKGLELSVALTSLIYTLRVSRKDL